MKTPHINQDIVDWLQVCFDTTPRKGDSNETLRWKGAQREVLDTVAHTHNAQRIGTTLGADAFKRKSDD